MEQQNTKCKKSVNKTKIKNMGKVKAKVFPQPSKLVPCVSVIPSPAELRHNALIKQQLQEGLRQFG